MKIICSEEEAKTLITNCNQEQCEFCFLMELCHDVVEKGSIISLIEVEKPKEIEIPRGWEKGVWLDDLRRVSLHQNRDCNRQRI